MADGTLAGDKQTLSGALTGAEWLHLVSFDVFDHIVMYLDIKSLIRLASTCKGFQQVIADDRVLWIRQLRNVAAEHFVAPHSFDHISTARDLRKAASRPARFLTSILSPDVPPSISLRSVQYDFSYDEILPDTNLSPLPPILLPGGRWILSAALSDDGLTTYLFCWDTQLAANDPLKPVAHLTLEGLPIDHIWGSWAQTQLEMNSESVIIAVSWSSFVPTDPWLTNSRSFQVLRLSWGKDPSAKPTFSKVALLPNHAVYMPTGSGGWNFSLEGDYITIDSSMDILVWNWKEDTIGAIDPEGHEWADGSGFLVCVRPPFLYVIPHELGEIVAIQIPKFDPQGTSHHPISSPLTVSYPLNDHRIPELRWSSVDIFDRWQPPALRHGFVTLITRTGMGEVHRIIRLPPPEQSTAPPTSALQGAIRFRGVPLASFSVVNGAKHGIVMEMEERSYGANQTTEAQGVDVSIRAFPFNDARQCFFKPISQSVHISDLDGYAWTGGVEIGSFCLASGTALLTGRDNAVAILHFD